jgi:enoyl-CoA hydratase/carnithine racemase
LLYDANNKIVAVTMNRPERLNDFGDGLYEALEEFLHLMHYDPDVNVAVMTGAGVVSFTQMTTAFS